MLFFGTTSFDTVFSTPTELVLAVPYALVKLGLIHVQAPWALVS